MYYFVYRRRFTKPGRVQQKIGDEGEENPFARKELDGKGILGVVEIADGSPPQAELDGREVPTPRYELDARKEVSISDEVENRESERSGK